MSALTDSIRTIEEDLSEYEAQYPADDKPWVSLLVEFDAAEAASGDDAEEEAETPTEEAAA